MENELVRYLVASGVALEDTAAALLSELVAEFPIDPCVTQYIILLDIQLLFPLSLAKFIRLTKTIHYYRYTVVFNESGNSAGDMGQLDAGVWH